MAAPPSSSPIELESDSVELDNMHSIPGPNYTQPHSQAPQPNVNGNGNGHHHPHVTVVDEDDDDQETIRLLDDGGSKGMS